MKKRNQILFLTLILTLAAFLRLWRLDQVPPSPSLDEVSIGWNAFSLLKTGKDEYGYRWPISLRAYDDWRPALYVYLVIPFVKLLGLSVFAVRLPAVLLSLLTVGVTFLLVQELLKDSHLALLAILMLAISPWHLYLSRLGHEVSVGLTFSVMAILFFVRAVNRKNSFFPSAFFWALTLYTYQAQKLFSPLMVLFLAIIYKKFLAARKKEVILAAFLGLILTLPFLRVSFSPQTLVRFRATNLLAHQPELFQKASLKIARDYQHQNLIGLVFDNRRVAAFLSVGRSYFSHFNPSWLFFNSGEEKHKIPGLGLFYLWELPLLVLGTLKLAQGSYSREVKLLLLIWLLAAPVPAGLTTEAPHAMRSFSLLPVPQILSGLGGLFVWKKLARRQRFFKGATIALFLLSLVYIYHNYFFNFPFEQSDSFQYPLKKAIEFVLAKKHRYQSIVFSNQNHTYQSYMFWLFFSQYDPGFYLSQGGTVSGGYAEPHQFDKYEFRPIDWGKEKAGNLYVGNFDDFPQDFPVVAEFKTLDSSAALKAVKK